MLVWGLPTKASGRDPVYKDNAAWQQDDSRAEAACCVAHTHLMTTFATSAAVMLESMILNA